MAWFRADLDTVSTEGRDGPMVIREMKIKFVLQQWSGTVAVMASGQVSVLGSENLVVSKMVHVVGEEVVVGLC